MDIYKSLYTSYYWIDDKVKNSDPELKKYVLIGLAIGAFLVYWNIGTIIWWGLLFVLFYLFYKSQKKNVDNIDREMEDICKDKPDLEICKIYNQSKSNHKKIIESIRDKLSHG